METFPIVHPTTGEIVRVTVVRDEKGQTHLVRLPMPTGFSTEKEGD